MAGARVRRKPTFLWQAALIVLPVAVLAAFGWISMLQDRNLTRHDAAERAGAVASELLPKIWDELTMKRPADLTRNAFRVDGSGGLVFPPPYAPVPTPNPFNLSALTAEQTRLWTAVQGGGSDESSLDVATQACRQFLDSNPPPDLAGAACYALGLRLIQARQYESAATLLALIPEKYPGAVGESGIPLEPLSRMKLLELTVTGLATNQITRQPSFGPEAFYSNVVYHPTSLTPFLLERESRKPKPEGLSNKAWQRVWADHELSRELYLAASKSRQETTSPLPPPLISVQALPGSSAEPGAHATGPLLSIPRAEPSLLRTPRLSWLNRNWLAVRFDEDSTHHWFVWHPDSEVESKVEALVKAQRQMPEYLGVGVEVAGRRLILLSVDLRLWRHVEYTSKYGGGVKKGYLNDTATEILGSAAKSDDGTELLKVDVYLTSPTALFERQRARAFWFGSLIAVSTLVALVGLVASARSFLKQRELSELKSNFVSSVSHELRAPIASVRLMAESLERGKIQEPPKQKEYFAFIVQECRRLSSLIENVLDFSRIEQGRKQYEFEPTDLLALARETVKLMEPYAAEKGISLRLDAPDSKTETPNLELELDGRAIQQALVNLIDNAIKHSPKGETVEVGVQVQSPKSKVQSAEATTCDLQPATFNLSVSDHGPGIPPEEHEKIFERFYRRGSELRRETQGVGIGLSIVKHIVEAHGGRVRVESQAGQGSRFTIELPFNHRDTETQGLE